jgi:L-threonylcarbamoyladenylate synthase
MPSANRSEHVSPTTPDHVRQDLPGVPVLDDGPCRVGIESTVLSLAGEQPVLLRPGGIGLSDLRDVLGEIRIAGRSDVGIARSPGRLPRHYAPDVPTTVVDVDDPIDVPDAIGLVPAGVAFEGEHIALSADPTAAAEMLYATLRDLERHGRPIVIVLPPDEPAWRAVRDRLRRAGG